MATLHSLVWKTPLRVIAEQWNVTPASVAALCDTHRIPRPPNGHWTKLRLGNQDVVVALPDDIDQGEIIVIGAGQNESGLIDKTVARLEYERANPINVPSKLTRPHSLIERTRDGFARSKNSIPNSTLLYPSGKGTLDICVTKKSVTRALLIFDTLIKSVEARGHSIRIEPSDGRSVDTYLLIDHHKFEINMREKQIRVPRRATDEERQWRPEREESFDLVSTGLLYLNVRRHRWQWPEKQFREGKKRKRLEASLNQFFCTIYRMIDEIEQRETQRKFAEAELGENEARKAAEQRIAAAEVQRRDHLLTLVRRWDTSQRIQEFIEAFRARSSLPINEVEAMVTWMSKQADDIDPLSDPELQF